MAKRVTVLLLERVDGLGGAGDVVDVSEGYARNYLFRQGLAAFATESRLRDVDDQKKKEERRAGEDLVFVEGQVEQIDGMVIPVSIAIGPNGKAHGSITSSVIGSKLYDTVGMRIPKESIHLSEPIREPGEHKVRIEFPHGLEAEITIEVRPEEKPGARNETSD